jgi:hypothetical protein
VLINYDTRGALVYSTDHTITDTTSIGWTGKISIIGSDWKSFDMGSFAWEVLDNMVFFVETQNSDVFRLVFTGFDGMSTGNINFDKELIYTQSIFHNEVQDFDMNVYPNPANDHININYSIPGYAANVEIIIYDLAGRIVEKRNVLNQGSSILINDLTLTHGTYLLEMRSDKYAAREKLIVE